MILFSPSRSHHPPPDHRRREGYYRADRAHTTTPGTRAPARPHSEAHTRGTARPTRHRRSEGEASARGGRIPRNAERGVGGGRS